MSTHYKWLVKSRAKSQQLLLDLHTFIAANRGALASHDRDTEWSIVGLLIGATFSLWRAAFLAFDADRKNAVDVIDDAQAFLTKLIEDNAINYPQDRATAEWSSGYYLNGARYRLNAVLEKFPRLGLSVDDPEFVKLRKLHAEGIRSTDAAAAWDQFFAATMSAFAHLTRAWNQPVRGRRKPR